MTNFLRNKSTNFHKSCTPSSMAHNTKLQKIKQHAKFIIVPLQWYP